MKYLLGLLVAAVGCARLCAADPLPEVKSLHVQILSTMLADGSELGEWGFSALVEADGHRILYDTGEHGDFVLRNVQGLQVDLRNVPDVILSHHHSDHVGGLMTLRNSVRASSPTALSRAHVAPGIFTSRRLSGPNVEENPMLEIRTDYEKSGGTFIVHDHPEQLYPGIWLTGPVPRKYPEHNWSGSAQINTREGWVEDNLPEDMALIINTADGLVVVTGCGHAGIVNICTYAQAQIRQARFRAIIGGIHLFNASKDTVRWTGEKLYGFGVDNFIGAHCTGIETVYAFRGLLHLDQAHDVVGAVGASYDLQSGIDPGHIVR